MKADLLQSLFVEAELTEANCSGANMSQCILHEAKCVAVQFDGTDLKEAELDKLLDPAILCGEGGRERQA